MSFKKSENFVGREALNALRETIPERRMVTFSVETEDCPILGNETIYRNGKKVGWIATGGYGHTIERSIGLGYVRHDGGVDKEFILNGDFELEVAMTRYPAKVQFESLYDPGNLKTRC